MTKSKAKKMAKQPVVMVIAKPQGKAKPHNMSQAQGRKIKGTGDYTLPSNTPGQLAQVGGKSWGRAGGEAIGNLFGGSVGSAVGGFLGDTAHSIFKSITGWGSYSMRSAAHHKHMTNNGHTKDPSVILAGSPPSFSQGDDSTIVTHREYIGHVNGSTAFATTSYPIQPGLPSAFPWLATQAQGWDQYEVLGMVYEFRSSSDIVVGTNTAAGLVYMSTQYNADYLPFSTEQQIGNNEYTTSSKPELDFYHMVECKPSNSQARVKNIRQGALPTNADLRLSDVGFLQVTTIGQQATGGHIGDLWCTYRVRLLKPTLPVPGAYSGNGYLHIQGTASTSGNGTTSGLLTSAAIATTSNIPVTVVNTVSAAQIRFPDLAVGNYLLAYVTSVSTGTIVYTTAPSFIFGTGVTVAPLFSVDTNSTVFNSTTNTTGTQSQILLYSISVPAPLKSFNLNINGVLASIGGSTTNTLPDDFFVIQLPSGVNALPPSRMVEDPASILLRKKLAALEDRLARLDQCVAASSSAPAPSRRESVDEEEKFVDDMSASVHLPRAIYHQMMNGIALPKL
jgi:hypothetical protein